MTCKGYWLSGSTDIIGLRFEDCFLWYWHKMSYMNTKQNAYMKCIPYSRSVMFWWSANKSRDVRHTLLHKILTEVIVTPCIFRLNMLVAFNRSFLIVCCVYPFLWIFLGSREPEVSVTYHAQLLNGLMILQKTRIIYLYVETSYLLVCNHLKCSRKYYSNVSWFGVLFFYLINCYSWFS